MKKLHFIMADTNVAYMEAVSAYTRGADQAAKFDLKLFSTKEGLLQYLDSGPHCDILLISPHLLSDEIPEEKIRSVISLEDDQISSVETGLPAVFKYQPLNQLFSEILSIYYDQHGKMEDFQFKTSGTKVISVFSAAGGTGKTTLAVNLSKQLALQDNKVFYLNLELLHSTPLFFSSSEQRHSSQILYYVKANQEQLVSKIESLKKYDAYAQVNFFDFPVNGEEMMGITEEEAESLISGIMEAESPDYLIIDLDSLLHGRVIASLSRSDRICWVLGNDLQSFHKSSAFLENRNALLGERANVLDKTTFILNKYTGSLSTEFERYDLPIKHYLPYIPEWKNALAGNEMMSSSVFSEALLPLVKTEKQSQEV